VRGESGGINGKAVIGCTGVRGGGEVMTVCFEEATSCLYVISTISRSASKSDHVPRYRILEIAFFSPSTGEEGGLS
jgi:hypothetical protein